MNYEGDLFVKSPLYIYIFWLNLEAREYNLTQQIPLLSVDFYILFKFWE